MHPRFRINHSGADDRILSSAPAVENSPRQPIVFCLCPGPTENSPRQTIVFCRLPRRYENSPRQTTTDDGLPHATVDFYDKKVL